MHEAFGGAAVPSSCLATPVCQIAEYISKYHLMDNEI